MSLAVYEHHTEIAMLLVHRGADVNVVEEVKCAHGWLSCMISNGYLPN